MSQFKSLEEVYEQFPILVGDADPSYDSVRLKIFNGEHEGLDKDDPIVLNTLMNYYKYIKVDYELMKKCCYMAIKQDNLSAMNNLGYYYQHVKPFPAFVKKYYKRAIDKGDVWSMYDLGYYYENVEKDMKLKQKYFSMAIEADKQNMLKDRLVNSNGKYWSFDKFSKLRRSLRLVQKQEDISKAGESISRKRKSSALIHHNSKKQKN